jgi:hypothetical protein
MPSCCRPGQDLSADLDSGSFVGSNLAMALDNPKIKETKMDAAKRQLRTAIRLWFKDGDPVSIHTLAAAAHEIIHTLYRRKGLNDLLFDSSRIKDEFRSEWAKSIKKAPTFFKHAQHDPDGEIEFNPALNHILVFIICAGLHRMGEPEGLEEMALTRWLLAHEPELFLKQAFDRVPIDVLEQVKGIKKSEYFDGFELFWGKANFLLE